MDKIGSSQHEATEMWLFSQHPATKNSDLFIQNLQLEIGTIAFIGFDEQSISVPARVVSKKKKKKVQKEIV